MKDCVSILKVIIDTRDGFKQCSMLSINEIYVTVKDTCNRRLLNLFTYKTLKQMKCTIICFNNVWIQILILMFKTLVLSL